MIYCSKKKYCYFTISDKIKAQLDYPSYVIVEFDDNGRDCYIRAAKEGERRATKVQAATDVVNISKKDWALFKDTPKVVLQSSYDKDTNCVHVSMVPVLSAETIKVDSATVTKFYDERVMEYVARLNKIQQQTKGRYAYRIEDGALRVYVELH